MAHSCTSNKIALLSVCAKRLVLLCEIRKYTLEHPGSSRRHFKTMYLKNTIAFMNNIRLYKDVAITTEGLPTNKISVFHVRDIVKYLQTDPDFNEVRKSLSYILDKCDEIPDREYFVDLSDLFY